IVNVYEPADGWSRRNLVAERGHQALEKYRREFPQLYSIKYSTRNLNLTEMLRDVDLVIVHEWNSPALVKAIGQHRKIKGQYCLLFHDTHHRLISAGCEFGRDYLSGYDGILAFGEALREMYNQRGYRLNTFTWHEAADIELFKPLGTPKGSAPKSAAVWIGNWGDEERSSELEEYVFAPVTKLNIKTRIYGVRYPTEVKKRLSLYPFCFGGWSPNYLVPQIFSEHKVTWHVPRRFYREQLPGIPTIRVFEALACGIPLICAPWQDTENLFSVGRDFLIARDRSEMEEYLAAVLTQPEFADQLARSGRSAILKRHTCRHRIKELFSICRRLGVSGDFRSVEKLTSSENSYSEEAA
ncbi:MAG: glycosyltransferase, partial [Bdellovibrionales bacterium]|nr:glycosyltransferase [Bdellovibrionales bacterium]